MTQTYAAVVCPVALRGRREMSTSQEEKRQGRRIHAALPVYLKSATGVTRDVSTSGVYFLTEGAWFSPGESIYFSVELSRPGGKTMLKCRGDVVRTEEREPSLGVAVRIVESSFQLT